MKRTDKRATALRLLFEEATVRGVYDIVYCCSTRERAISACREFCEMFDISPDSHGQFWAAVGTSMITFSGGPEK